MAGKYWSQVFRGAWDRTYKPLGWDRKKVALVLLAIGAIIVAGAHLGLAAMITTATGYFWIAVPAAFAAAVLFFWGVFQTQAEMYATSVATIAELEVTLAQSKQPPPDYAAYRHVDLLRLREAAFLWCDLPPRISMPANVQAWLNALASSVRRGDIDFEPQPKAFIDHRQAKALEQLRPTADTVVKRTELQRWAKLHGHDPIFLRDS
jgi:hypothetical protein